MLPAWTEIVHNDTGLSDPPTYGLLRSRNRWEGDSVANSVFLWKKKSDSKDKAERLEGTTESRREAFIGSRTGIHSRNWQHVPGQLKELLCTRQRCVHFHRSWMRMSTAATLCAFHHCLLGVWTVRKIPCIYSSQVFSLRGAMPKAPHFTPGPNIHGRSLNSSLSLILS